MNLRLWFLLFSCQDTVTTASAGANKREISSALQIFFEKIISIDIKLSIFRWENLTWSSTILADRYLDFENKWVNFVKVISDTVLEACDTHTRDGTRFRFNKENFWTKLFKLQKWNFCTFMNASSFTATNTKFKMKLWSREMLPQK